MRSKVSEQAVLAACDTLAARGEAPTYEAIISMLGGGSNSTVQPYLHAWKERSRPSSRPMPDEVDARAKMLAQAVWLLACSAAEPEIELVRVAGAKQLEASREALNYSIAANEKFEQQVRSLDEAAASLQNYCSELQLQVREFQPIREALDHAEAAGERWRNECGKAGRAFAKLQGENAALMSSQTALMQRLSTKT